MRKITLFSAFLPFLLMSQTQIGSDILGEASGNQFGYSTAVSSDGSIIAVGARLNGGTGTNAGHVRVYENIGGVWTQVGADIDGEAASDFSGWDVSLSSDGSIVAIGAVFNDGASGADSGQVRVYENVGGTWTQVGGDIDGEAAGDQLGFSVSLSSDGSILAAGAIGNDGTDSGAGHVRVYQNVGGTWTQIGADIDGDVAVDQMGHSVSLSSDGTKVAVGARLYDGVGGDSGLVRVYENVANVWTKVGGDIGGEIAGDQFGFDVSLSSDGSVVAAGGPFNDGVNGSNSGHVRVYENVGGTWTQVGSDIDGEAIDDLFGNSVSLSSNGEVIVVGGHGNDATDVGAGHARVYQNVGGTWTQIGSDIDGEAANNVLGYNVSISSDGTVVVIGSHAASSNGEVEVYLSGYVLTSENHRASHFLMYPNPAQHILNIGLQDGAVLEKINIYNSLGQFVTNTREENHKVDVSGLKSGIYFIEVKTNLGSSTRKMIIH